MEAKPGQIQAHHRVTTASGRMRCFLTAWIVLALGLLTVNPTFAKPREICVLESFNAHCGENETILMTSALYGRMKLGRCLTRDYYRGCKTDVLRQMDERCTGRRQCKVSIPDQDLYNSQPCPKDLMAYLEADYQCVAVSNPGNFSCSTSAERPKVLPVTTTPGYLAHGLNNQRSVVMTSGGGYGACVWRLEAPPGQTINLTLYEVSYGHRSLVGSNRGSHQCMVYATVKERLGDGLRENVICGGTSGRLSIVYASKGNALYVEIPQFSAVDGDGLSGDGVPRFLLKYQASGCRDPILGDGMSVQRRQEQLHVRCNATLQTWHLVCRGSDWVGTVGNCSQDRIGSESESGFRSSGYYFDFPNGIAMAIIIGVILGVLIGFCLLLGVYQLRKQRRGQHRQDIMLSEADMAAPGAVSKADGRVTGSKGRLVDVTDMLPEGFDAHDPMLPPSVTLDREGRIISTNLGVCHYNKRPTDRDHVYERPQPGSEPPRYPDLGGIPDCLRCTHAPSQGYSACNLCKPHQHQQQQQQQQLQLAGTFKQSPQCTGLERGGSFHVAVSGTS